MVRGLIGAIVVRGDVGDVALLDERQQHIVQRACGVGKGGVARVGTHRGSVIVGIAIKGGRGADGRQRLVGRHEVVDRQSHLLEVVARTACCAAASRTFCTAGKSRPIRTAMMAMTTSNSMRVKAGRDRRERRREVMMESSPRDENQQVARRRWRGLIRRPGEAAVRRCPRDTNRRGRFFLVCPLPTPVEAARSHLANATSPLAESRTNPGRGGDKRRPTASSRSGLRAPDPSR